MVNSLRDKPNMRASTKMFIDRTIIWMRVRQGFTLLVLEVHVRSKEKYLPMKKFTLLRSNLR